MNDLIRPAYSENKNATMEELRQLPVDELRRMLGEAISVTAHGLLRMAFLIAVLEEKEQDLSGLRIGVLHHLRKVACGQLLPEVILQFACKPQLIAIIGNLPLPDQRRLAAGEPVKLLVYDPTTKQRTHRPADPLNMMPDQVRQAFARDHIRDEAEQALFLDARREDSMRPIPATVAGFRIDKERGGIYVGRKFLSKSDMRNALKVLGD